MRGLIVLSLRMILPRRRRLVPRRWRVALGLVGSDATRPTRRIATGIKQAHLAESDPTM